MSEGIIDYFDKLEQENKEYISGMDKDLRVKFFHIQNSQMDFELVSSFPDQLKYLVYISFLKNYSLSFHNDFVGFFIIFDIVYYSLPNDEESKKIQKILSEVLELNLKLCIFKIDLKNVGFTHSKIIKYREIIDSNQIITHFCIRIMSIIENLIKKPNLESIKMINQEIPAIINLLNPKEKYIWFFRHLKIYFETLIKKIKEVNLQPEDLNKLNAKSTKTLKLLNKLQKIDIEINKFISIPPQELANLSHGS